MIRFWIAVLPIERAEQIQKTTTHSCRLWFMNHGGWVFIQRVAQTFSSYALMRKPWQPGLRGFDELFHWETRGVMHDFALRYSVLLHIFAIYHNIYHREASQCLRTCSTMFILFILFEMVSLPGGWWNGSWSRGSKPPLKNPGKFQSISAWTTFDWKVDLPILINHLRPGLITLQWI